MAVSVDVSSWIVEQPEAGGGGANLWLRDRFDRRWLYKATRRSKYSGELQGEDWAEKASEGLAALLGVPTARVELAHIQRPSGLERGVISLDLSPPGVEFQGGFHLLTSFPGYRFRDERDRPPRDHVGHSVANVHQALAENDVQAPPGFEPSSFDAFDVFAGYLLLDAWVGNQDRHEENWAILRAGSGEISLAPSFDHGASLGFLLSEEQRREWGADPLRLKRFAEGGRAAKFEGRRLELTTVAAEALNRASEAARQHWLSRLKEVQRETCATLLSDVPRLSEASRRFCLELLDVNRRRLLDVCQ